MPNLIYAAVGDDGAHSIGDTLLGDLQGIPMNEQIQVENHVMLDSESITLHEDLAFNGEILHQVSPSKSTDEEERNTTDEFCIMPTGLSFYQVMPSRGPRSTVNVTINELGKQLLGCAKEGDVDGVRSLMAKGAPFASDFLGTSALHLAAQYNQYSTAELLLRAGISRDARTKVEKTALHIAATEGHVSVVQLLISYGAEVNAKDMLRMTPLHWAVDRGHVEVIRVLLESGASTEVRSKFDKTPLDVAKDYSRSDLVDYMQSIEPLQQPTDAETDGRENDREMEAATRSIAVDNVHVPAVLHQEEVETSVQDGGSNHSMAHEYLERRVGGSSRGPSLRACLEEELAHSSSRSTMQLLEAHGITMLPEDEGTIVDSALEEGQTVVLTDADKLGNHFQTPLVIGKQNVLLMNEAPVYLDDAGKLALEHPLKGLEPKMLKKISSGQAVLVPKQSTKGLTSNSLQSLPKKTIAMRQYKAHIPEKKSVEEAERILARAVAGTHSSTEVVDDTCSVEELEKKLEEALQAARHHKQLALEKERQVVMYRRQVETLKPYLSWPMSAVRRARRKVPKSSSQRRGNCLRPVLPFIAPRLDYS